jgi:hypothetical protein
MEWEDEYGINRLFGSEDESDKLPSSRRKVKEVPDLEDSSSESENEEEGEEGKEEKANTTGESSSSSSSEDESDGSPQSPAVKTVAGCTVGGQESGAPPQEKATGEDLQQRVKKYLEARAKDKNSSLICERLGLEINCLQQYPGAVSEGEGGRQSAGWRPGGHASDGGLC